MDNPNTQVWFRERLSCFVTAWNEMLHLQPDLNKASMFTLQLDDEARSLPGSLNIITERLRLIQDALNDIEADNIHKRKTSWNFLVPASLQDSL